MEPRIIKTEAEYEAALAHVKALMDAEPGSLQEQELELFALLVEQYEQEHFPMDSSDPVASLHQYNMAPVMTDSNHLHVVHLDATHHAEIVDLWQRAGLHIRQDGRDSLQSFTQQMATGVQTPIGLRDGERLVALVLATHDSRKGWINRLAVDPDYRRQGKATRLIRLCEEHFHSRGIDIWAALIEDWNEASLALFRQAGFALAEDITYASRRSRADV